MNSLLPLDFIVGAKSDSIESAPLIRTLYLYTIFAATFRFLSCPTDYFVVCLAPQKVNHLAKILMQTRAITHPRIA
jgi:hypothetical protein